MTVTTLRHVPGYLAGVGFSSIRFETTLAEDCADAVAAADARLAAMFPELQASASIVDTADTPANADSALAGWLLGAVRDLQRFAGLPVMVRGQHQRYPAGHDAFTIPCRAVDAGRLVALFTALAEMPGGGPEAPVEAAFAALKANAHTLSNSAMFIEAAHMADMPIRTVVADVMQVGYGSRARTLRSTLTDDTPAIGTSLAKGKMLGAAMMRQAGLPVPRHGRAETVEHAIALAGQLGYPVVVKPTDQDGGAGVVAGIETPEELRTAFDAARVLSANVMVEKHFEGRDYRMIVHDGETLFIGYREPGGVHGNGRDTIEALVAEVNRQPNRGHASIFPLRVLEINDEATQLMARQGFDAGSVPPAGTFVRMRGIANVSRGGTPHIIPLESAHPDNLDLAARAARALLLDVAGVDLLIPDIARSWRESGAAICEVNAQPTIGFAFARPVYGQLLRRMVAGDGRIPVVAVFGSPDSATLVAAIEAAAAPSGTVLGCADATGARVAGGPVSAGWLPAYDAGIALTLDRRVEGMILAFDDPGALATGFPVDRIDCLVIASPHVSRAQNVRESAGLLRQLIAMTRGEVLVVSPAEADHAAIRRLAPDAGISNVDPAEVAARAATHLGGQRP